MIPRLGFPAVDASQSVVGQFGYAGDSREEFFPSRPSLGRNPNRRSRPSVNTGRQWEDRPRRFMLSSLRPLSEKPVSQYPA